MRKLRVEFVTVNDPLYILPFFEEFFRHYRDEVDIVHVSLCRTMGKRSRKKLAQELMALYGPLGFFKLGAYTASSTVLGLLPKPPDAPSYHSMRQLCRAYEVACSSITSASAAEFVPLLKSRECDLLISVACPFVLGREVLATPPQGCINIHHAPLPKYRGMMPTFWQLYHGEKAVGLTIHAMTEKLDEGAIFYQSRIEVSPGESLHELIRRCKRQAAHCLAGVLRSVQSGELKAVDPEDTTSSYFSFPTVATIREFRKRGLRAI